METKASIRTKYKTLRNAMPENIVREESQRICQNISTWEIFQKAKNCFFYYPLGKEASLLPFLTESIQNEINNIINTCYDKTLKLLKQNINDLHIVSKFLFENETMTCNELEDLIRKEAAN